MERKELYELLEYMVNELKNKSPEDKIDVDIEYWTNTATLYWYFGDEKSKTLIVCGPIMCMSISIGDKHAEISLNSNLSIDMMDKTEVKKDVSYTYS